MAQNAPTASAPVGRILSDLAENTQTLLRQQVELVRAETTEKISEEARSKGRAVGLLVGGGIFALLGLAFLGIMLIFGLQAWFGLSAWLAALIVTLLYFAIGGLLAYVGKSALTPEPEEPAVPSGAEQLTVQNQPPTS